MKPNERMRVGPCLMGGLIVIPSERYSEEAREFWKSLGARWAPDHPYGPSWVLNTAFSIHGTRWSTSAWLETVRDKFFEFYPFVKMEVAR